MLHEYIVDNGIDACVVSETWLKNNDEDKAWVACSILNRDGNKISAANRLDRTGGGLALIYNNKLKMENTAKENLETFEFAKWKIEFYHTKLTIVAIYRPPYSSRNQHTIPAFLNESTEWIGDHLTDDENLIFTGNFNIYISKNDSDAQAFIDITEALGLTQHVRFETHRVGNILDLVLKELGSKLHIPLCLPGPILSDHRAVEFTVSIPKENYTKLTITFRDIKNIDSKEFIDIIQPDEISDMEDIDEMSDLFNTRLEKALEMLAPLTTKSVVIRRKVPCFTHEVKDQKRKLRKSKETWRKNRSKENWMNLKLECMKYNNILKSSKVQSISKKVLNVNMTSRRCIG